MFLLRYIFVALVFSVIQGHIINNFIQVDKEIDRLFDFTVEIIRLYYKKNGWQIIITYGILPNILYKKIQSLGTVLTNDFQDNHDMENKIPYYANSIIISCNTIEELEIIVAKAKEGPSWHPLANVYIYLQQKLDQESIGFIHYIMWYERIANAIILYYDRDTVSLQFSSYTPYANDNYQLQHNMGCYLVNKIGIPVNSLSEDLKCEQNCENITKTSKYRQKHLGTCIGYNFYSVKVGDILEMFKLNLFEDKGKNLHSFALRCYVIEVLPFLGIEDHGNGSYSLQKRDGHIWNAMAEKMNFTFDFTPSITTIKNNFSYELSIQNLFSFSVRNGELFIAPIYLLDYVIVKVDWTFPYHDSGVCIVSQRADFETIVFDMQIIEQNWPLLIEFAFCFLCVWITFTIFKIREHNNISFDQIGKDLLNAIRNVLSLSLYFPPKSNIFRIFLMFSIWCFFIINFSMQAAIISLFTAVKRGKEVEYFEDIIETGYNIEGMASPDVILPEEEKYNKLKIVPINDLFECINKMADDPHRFCMIDCAVGRYLERNKLNKRGHQYLHIIKDRIHSLYLNFVLQNYSPLTNEFNENIVRLVEGGIIRKWEEYKFTEIKEEAVLKPLSKDDLMGIYKSYWFLVANSCIIFTLEVLIGIIYWFKVNFSRKFRQWRIKRLAMHSDTKSRKRDNNKMTHVATQTVPTIDRVL